jgi:hypothetical protein
MTEEERQRERAAVLSRLDSMVRSISESSLRMEASAKAMMAIAACIDSLNETLATLDERLERFDQFFAWLSEQTTSKKKLPKNPIENIFNFFKEGG